MKGIWKWITYYRFTVVTPIFILLFWVILYGCSPRVESPLQPGKLVSTSGLATDFKVWQAEQSITMIKFEAAGKNLELQREQQTKFFSLLLKLAGGSVASWPGLLQLLISGGFLAAVGDNIRKDVVLSIYKKKAATNGNHPDSNNAG